MLAFIVLLDVLDKDLLIYLVLIYLFTTALFAPLLTIAPFLQQITLLVLLVHTLMLLVFRPLLNVHVVKVAFTVISQLCQKKICCFVHKAIIVEFQQ